MRDARHTLHRGAWMHGRDEAGFSLVEVMIAMGITLIVLASSFRAFDDARRASEAGSMLADGSQNLRIGVTLMTRDAIQTGRGMPIGGLPIPRGGGAAAIARPGPPGSVLTFPTGWTVLPSICPGSALGPVVNGVSTDILTVLYADTSVALNQYPLASLLSDGSRMTVDARTLISDARTALRPGDLIYFTNAIGTAVQTVTAVQGSLVSFAQGNVADAFGFNQRTATSGTILQIRSGTVFPTTSATRVVMVSYYVDTATVPGQARLMRREGFGTARLVGMGIENLQLTFDIVDGSTNPVNQVDAVSPYAPSQIRKVNLFLSGRSELPFSRTQQPMRSSMATQVSLRSMSFRDQYR